ncbi:MAG: ankyrin repeat domain-containing protein, partial [Elusimicrobiaceae bacterium]|nr:ankyrin repeat domain-containing protein [Elusimicrobiaceae bacterium]
GAQADLESKDNILKKALNLRKYNALYVIANFGKEKQISFRFPSKYFTMAMIQNNTNLANAVLPLTDNKVVNRPNNFGVLPLVQAAFLGNFKLMDNLIENGANLELRDQHLRTPMLAYLQEVYIAQIEGNLRKGNEAKIAETVKHFLEKGADITVRDDYGEDIMFYAVRGKNKPLIELLLTSYNLNIDTRNKYGETPLFVAAQNATSLVPFMITKGANPKVMDKKGRTPAIAAVELGHINTYDFLESAAAAKI